MLVCPENAVLATATGLVLWYERVIPALLPFSILSNIIIQSNELDFILKKMHKPLCLFFPISENGSFALLSGLLFGFPMGSKNCAELLKQEKISLEEANILFIITNNISPVFINSYILLQQLQQEGLFLWSLLAIYLPALLYGNFRLHHIKKENFLSHKKTASRSKINFQIIDAGIMNGFETLARIGGYIMLFSILISIIQTLPLPSTVKTLCISSLEVTNGIQYIANTTFSIKTKYILAMSFTAFGGLCGIAQTSSMIQGTQLDIKEYVVTKLILATVTAVLAYIIALLI